MSSGNVFERTEKKYLMSRKQYEDLKESIQSFIQLDPYPQYTIYNLYFDTCDYEFIYHSIEKPMYKEKLRLRSYGPVDGTGKVYLELKKKCNGVVFKRRVTLGYEEAMAYLLENKFPIINWIYYEWWNDGSNGD